METKGVTGNGSSCLVISRNLPPTLEDRPQQFQHLYGAQWRWAPRAEICLAVIFCGDADNVANMQTKHIVLFMAVVGRRHQFGKGEKEEMMRK